MGVEPQIVTSESEEMYLITIARAVEDGHAGPVPIPRVASALGVSQVAANEMVKKLAGRSLVDYVPYRGVTLTPSGDMIAQGVLRRRRLWGVFLTGHLGLSPEDADAAACEFEHVTPPDVESRLATFLGAPVVGPHGRRIPPTDTSGSGGRSLADVAVGTHSAVLRIDASAAVASFLEADGIAPGSQIGLAGRNDDGTTLIAVGDTHIEITADVASAVFVAD